MNYLQTETAFDVAQDIANFAARLDDLKKSFPPEIKALAGACAEKMHLLAEHLAGDRAGEIYSPDDGSAEPLPQPEEECYL